MEPAHRGPTVNFTRTIPFQGTQCNMRTFNNRMGWRVPKKQVKREKLRRAAAHQSDSAKRRLSHRAMAGSLRLVPVRSFAHYQRQDALKRRSWGHPRAMPKLAYNLRQSAPKPTGKARAQGRAEGAEGSQPPRGIAVAVWLAFNQPPDRRAIARIAGCCWPGG